MNRDHGPARTFAAIVLPAVAISLIATAIIPAGCLKQEPFSTLPQDIDPAGREITFWYGMTADAEQTLLSLVQDFNRSNRWGVSVHARHVGSTADIHERLTALGASSAPPEAMPDALEVSAGQVPAFWSRELLIDLRPYIDDPDWGLGETSTDHIDGLLRADPRLDPSDELLRFPVGGSAVVLLYNREWMERIGFRSPPSGWDAFARAVEAASDPARDRYGFAVQTDLAHLHAQAVSRGGRLAGDDGRPRLDNRRLRRSMELMAQLVDQGHAMLVEEPFGEQLAFAGRRVLFVLASTEELLHYDRAVRASTDGPFEWGVAPVPHGTARPALSVSTAGLGVARTHPRKQLAAWLFIRSLTAPRAQARLGAATGFLPVRVSAVEHMRGFLATHPQMREALLLLAGADLRMMPALVLDPTVHDRVEAAYRSVLGGAPAGQTLRWLDRWAGGRADDGSEGAR